MFSCSTGFPHLATQDRASGHGLRPRAAPGACKTLVKSPSHPIDQDSAPGLQSFGKRQQQDPYVRDTRYKQDCSWWGCWYPQALLRRYFWERTFRCPPQGSENKSNEPGHGYGSCPLTESVPTRLACSTLPHGASLGKR